MNSKQMNLDGDILDIDIFYDGQPIFRKYVSDSWGMNELSIAQKLMHSKNPHCVRIYDVVDLPKMKYIDMELLQFPIPKIKTHYDQYMHDIYCGLSELHDIKVIYIDLKSDNVGYSELDNYWKIFDFDCSGICNDTYDNWIVKPPFYYGYKNALKHYHQLEGPVMNINVNDYAFSNLLDIDQISYELFQQETNSYK